MKYEIWNYESTQKRSNDGTLELRSLNVWIFFDRKNIALQKLDLFRSKRLKPLRLTDMRLRDIKSQSTVNIPCYDISTFSRNRLRSTADLLLWIEKSYGELQQSESQWVFYGNWNKEASDNRSNAPVSSYAHFLNFPEYQRKNKSGHGVITSHNI